MCVIAAIPSENGVYLLKNRDRNYNPNLCLVQFDMDDIQTIALIDEVTQWLEGMNEAGIAIVNSALMVNHDEKEKKKSTSGQKSEDGARILKALQYVTLDEAVQSLLTYRDGIKGHTLVTDGTTLYHIESTSEHAPHVQKLNPSELHVFTNHGIHHKDAGYTEGVDKKSSHLRLQNAKKALSSCSEPHDMIHKLCHRYHDQNSPHNPVRDTEDMRTSSQLIFHPFSKSTWVHLMEDKVESFKIKDIRKSPSKGLLPFHQIIL